MHSVKNYLSRTSVALVSLLFVIFSVSPVSALGPTRPVGPQGTVGTTQEVGPKTDPGLKGPVGPGSNASLRSVTPTDSQISGENSNTGADSTNTNAVTDNNQTNSGTTNNAAITNNANLGATSGNNEAARNTLVGDISTGDINGTATIVNVANSQLGAGSTIGTQSLSPTNGSSLTLDPAANRGVLNGTNQNTGSGSSNTNLLDSNNVLQINNTNNANLLTGLNLLADTGNNVIDKNTQVGNITTGNATLGANVINMANVIMPNTTFTIDQWTLLNGYNGDLIIPQLANASTGPDSSNANNVTNTNQTNVAVNNNANATNQIAVNANTGNNTIDKNTQTGQVTTGDTNVQGSVQTIANITNPVLYIVNVFGKFLGSLVGIDPNSVVINEINQTTGPDSSNNNSVTQNNSTNATINNNAQANTDISITANTGNNTITNNGQVGDIKTGSVNVYANIVNVLNSMNVDLKKVTLGIVNIFGNFTGNIRSSAAPTPSSQTNTNTASTTGNTTENQNSNSSQTNAVVSAIQNMVPSTGGTSNSQTLVTIPNANVRKTTHSTSKSSSTEKNNTNSSQIAALPQVLLKDYVAKPVGSSSESNSIQSQVKSASKATIPLVLLLIAMLFWGGIELAAVRSEKPKK